MESIGVRELRQNASKYLDLVYTQGISIEITNHGHPVARLVPALTGGKYTRQQLIDAGLLAPATRRWEDLPSPLPAEPGTRPSSELLGETRQERL